VCACCVYAACTLCEFSVNDMRRYFYILCNCVGWMLLMYVCCVYCKLCVCSVSVVFELCLLCVCMLNVVFMLCASCVCGIHVICTLTVCFVYVGFDVYFVCMLGVCHVFGCTLHIW